MGTPMPGLPIHALLTYRSHTLRQGMFPAEKALS